MSQYYCGKCGKHFVEVDDLTDVSGLDNHLVIVHGLDVRSENGKATLEKNRLKSRPRDNGTGVFRVP